ncbi:MAG TPA: recombinase family protein [Thermodesulfobacteriota bacterium]|nr:recombinase family protein [Deltaproteobacteria bacterium]HNR13841.1 recombinase family protein [Thermodesulfobacteriota bacterium]HNU70372.1 recombinase family protein [Thermodesulfobacteriota bacterium]HOC39556.1 recombinase family protein [Thermodesulfobacteriota bacterium]
MKKAIAYTADIILGTTGEVISRAYQKELVRQYAAENDIEVAAWFEDELYEENVLMRPGIQSMVAYDGPAEVFLVERVWALSRSMATLREFFNVLAAKNVKLETATYLWDYTSQMVRREIATAVASEPMTKQDMALEADIATPAAASKPTMMKKAIAYVADIRSGSTGTVISRAYQKELIRTYAAENGIDVVAWFEDEHSKEELLKRPGIQAMIDYSGPAEIFLVERVWALSRAITTIRDFLQELAAKKVKLQTATYLWDGTSQMARRQLADAAAVQTPVSMPVTMLKESRRAAIAKPERFHFIGWAFSAEGETVAEEKAA